jgi:hypothetical protein
MAGFLAALQFLSCNAVDDRRDLVVRQRRPAAHRVPGSDKLQADLRIDVSPKQMAGEPGDAVIAGPLTNTSRDQFMPN